jgi:hypothetical protein
MGKILGFFSFVGGNIQLILITLVIGLSVGAGSTLYVKAKFEKAAIVSVLVEARKDDVVAVTESSAKEVELQKLLDTERSKFASYRKQFGNTVFVNAPQACLKENGNEVILAQVPISSDSIFISDGDVRMLNNVRSGVNDSATGVSDAEGKTPSIVTVKTLVESDAEVASLYNELSIRHNALVDFVDDLIKKTNAKILGTQ